jgi:ParB family chromosome partitioning protein
MIQDIDVGLVYPSSTSRPIDSKKVADIAASIKEIGLLSPICVRACVRHKGTTPFDAFNIVAGHHRYDAVCSLKWETILCNVVELDDLHAELAEIDENLMRAELSAAQEAAAVSRRKAIYEELHPETKADTFKGNRHTGSLANENPAFTSATAGTTGKSRRSIEISAARGEALGDDLKAIAGTSLDKGVELDALAKMSAGERAALIAMAAEGHEVSARRKVVESTYRDTDRVIALTSAEEFANWIFERLDPSELPTMVSWLEGTKPKDIIGALRRMAA